MTARKFNFNPGPAVLPLEVLQQASKDIINFRGCGMGIMEISHRGPQFKQMYQELISRARKIMNLGDDFHILFLGGGASSQFYMIPMNLLNHERTADYVNTGTWSKKAIKEAKLFGNVHVAGSSADSNFNHIPDTIQYSEKPAYVHITSNNTIFGTQWQQFPVVTHAPLICDMSSDFLSRRFDANAFDMIYAGAQKNIGPAGVTFILLKQGLLEKMNQGLPTMLTYQTHVNKDSSFNTPPVYGMYIINEVFKWILDTGGLTEIEAVNDRKAGMIYDIMDQHADFYRGAARKDSRSKMNITLRLPSETLEKAFLEQAEGKGFFGLKGHRSVGGIRVSMYNACPKEAVARLADFMLEFKKQQ